MRSLSLLASPHAAAGRPAASLLLRRPLSAPTSSSASMSETHEQHTMLRSDVKSLGRMLGDAISAHSGDEIFQKVCAWDVDQIWPVVMS